MSKPFYDVDPKTCVFTLAYNFVILDWVILWQSDTRYLLGRSYDVQLKDRTETFPTYEAVAAKAVKELSEKNADCTARMAELMREMTKRLITPKTEEMAK